MKESDLNSVKFLFRIQDDGEIIDLTGVSVRLAVQKPSGLTVFQDCTIVDAPSGTCEVVLSNQAYLEIGNHSGELILTAADQTTVTRSFSFTSLNAILDDKTLESANDWQALHEMMLNHDLRPILGDGSPNGVAMAEYVGQTYLDRLGMTMYFASTIAIDGWLPFGTGGGGGTTGTIYWNDVQLKPATFPPSAHTHLWSEISDPPTQMTPTAHTHDWGTGITNKPATFPPEEHTHDEYLTQTEADSLYQTLDTIPAHTHLWADITDKPTTFTPVVATPTKVGGAKIGNGLKMAGTNNEYLTIREGLGIKANTSTYALDIDKPTVDTWYTRTTQNLAIWKGTQTEYDGIGTPDPNTLYFITG